MPLLDLYSLWTGPPSSSTGAAVPTVAQLSVLYQADILVDGVAASTEGSEIHLTLTQGLTERTAFGDPAKWYRPMLYGVDVKGEFFYQTGRNLLANTLEAATAGPASSSLVITIAPDLAVGDLTYIFRAVNPDYQPHADYGEIIRADVTAQGGGNGRCVQAMRLLRASQTASSGTGTAVQLGAVASGQSLYAALNVIGTTQTPAGTVFTVISAPTSTLAGPTTRLTFTSGTSQAVGEWEEAAAAVTDTWWAASWSGFAGTSFTASISAGIE